MYEIAYSEEAIADLGWFKKHEQKEILDRIDQQLRTQLGLVSSQNQSFRTPSKKAS